MSAEFTSKNGFSVVAPTSTSTLSSTACKSASCWLLLKRWISSTKSMVRIPPVSSLRSAAEISRRRSDTVPPMAETSTNVALVVSATTCAMEVLPVPAGPNRITELSVSDSMALRSQLPSPTASACPTTSSSVRGRMRTASGATSMRRALLTSVNNESVFMNSILSLYRTFVHFYRAPPPTPPNPPPPPMENPPPIPLPLLLEESAALTVLTVFATVFDKAFAKGTPAPCM